MQRLGAEYDEAVYSLKKEQKELIQQIAHAKNSQHKSFEEARDQKGKCKQYKEKLRLANSTIKILTSKIAQQEMDRGVYAPNSVAQPPMSDDVRVGGLSIEGLGRDSNRGSEADIKEAIHKVMQDENLKSDIKRLFNQ